MATTDEKLDAILLMQAEILGRLQTLDPARGEIAGEDPRATALKEIGGTSKIPETATAIRAEVDEIVAMANQWGRSSS